MAFTLPTIEQGPLFLRQTFGGSRKNGACAERIFCRPH